jgi:hypothetical protein
MRARGSGIPLPSFCESQEFDPADVVKFRGDFFLNLTLPKIEEKMYIYKWR